MSEADDPPSRAPGQAEIIEATFRREAGRLARYFHVRLRGAGDPFDMVQEVFARLMTRSKRGEIDNPAAYMTRVARNLLIDHGRRLRVRAEQEEPYGPTMDIPVSAAQLSHVETKQMMDRFRQALDRLPPRTREVFQLHHEDDLLYREIADRLEISVRTVEWHMAEAMTRIRRMMDEG
jgi:RNA polymerase sigma-70 factor (ECF subfamily)